MKTLTDKLKKNIIFKNMKEDEIRKFVSDSNYKIEYYNKNETILSHDIPADKIGIILSGTVQVQKIFPSGKIIILDIKDETELIGEISVFSRMQHYTSTFISEKKSSIMFITKLKFQKIITNNSNIMIDILESIANSSIALKHNIGILSLNSIQEKIAAYLIHIQNHNNSYKTAERNTITLPFTKKTWSEYINVSRTSLSRELKNMENQGVITFKNRTIQIIDQDKLQKIHSL